MAQFNINKEIRFIFDEDITHVFCKFEQVTLEAGKQNVAASVWRHKEFSSKTHIDAILESVKGVDISDWETKAPSTETAQLDELIQAAIKLTREPVYEAGMKSKGMSTNLLARMTILFKAAGIITGDSLWYKDALRILAK